jgi:hypothetical protein
MHHPEGERLDGNTRPRLIDLLHEHGDCRPAGIFVRQCHLRDGKAGVLGMAVAERDDRKVFGDLEPGDGCRE